MPNWKEGGRWKGGRYYLNKRKERVFVIEGQHGGVRYSIKLRTHDEDLAVGELARFLQDPVRFNAEHTAPVVAALPKVEQAVFITMERVQAYMDSIARTVADHRNARLSYLEDWSKLSLDLKTVDEGTLRTALESFGGGHKGRVEALNAFANFLVRKRQLPTWVKLDSHIDAKETRAAREAYSLEQIQAAYAALEGRQRMKDVLMLRASTGLHHTEIAQIEGAKVLTSPLPDKGAAIRVLPEGHEIRGVLQVMHKSRRHHRQSLNQECLDAALRLSKSEVPTRISIWKALEGVGIVPSNLRHSFVTLAGECGREVTFSGAGVDRARIARAIGHRAGSTMTADHYDKLQVPPMIVLPFNFTA